MKTVHVVAAAIFEPDGRLLISRRHDHLHQGGLLEFPGGKVDPGETVEQALVRELEEELGITAAEFEPLIRIPHDYPDKRVLLDVWRVSHYQGEARGLEGQPLYRLAVDELVEAQFPAANRPVIKALQLPREYLITGEAEGAQQFLDKLQRALEAGIKLVQLRAHQLDDRNYRELACQALGLCNQFGAQLVLNRSLKAVEGVPADGVHLNRHQLNQVSKRQLEIWRTGLVGASCHSLEELRRAAELEVDYALLSPVLQTASHPEQQGMGWSQFAEWVDQVAMPVYALGGMIPAYVPEAIANGGQGVAAIGSYWR